MPADNERDRRGERAAVVCLLALLYAIMLVLYVKPRLVFGVWYDGGAWDKHMPPFLHAVFVGVRAMRAHFVAFSVPVVAAGVLAWAGVLDRVTRPALAVAITILVACAIVGFVVRSEVSQASAFRRALLND
jgi:hypothetical protein